MIILKKLIIVLLLFIPMLTSCKKEDVGEIYSLDYAYENNLISDDELLQIAYTYNSTHYDGEVDYGESFVPQEVNTDMASLDDDIVRKIKQAYYRYTGEDKKKVEVYFDGFYGKYDDFYVVSLFSLDKKYTCGDPAYYETYEIGPATFHRYSFLNVYKE